MKQKGKVKWFHKSEGFGFIEQDKNKYLNKYLFFHYTAIEKTGLGSLREGEEVEFEVVKGKSGIQVANAIKV